MKQLGILPILLLLGVGITSGLAAAELTASQSVPSLAAVGETVQVTVMLTYRGGNAAQVVVTPGLPSGIVTDIPGGQSAELYPGATAPISYPIRAVRSGTYTIISQIAYAEGGTWRELLLEAPFTAEGEIAPPPQEEISPMPGGEAEMPPADGTPGYEGGMPGGESGMPPADGTPGYEGEMPGSESGMPIGGAPMGGMPKAGVRPGQHLEGDPLSDDDNASSPV